LKQESDLIDLKILSKYEEIVKFLKSLGMKEFRRLLEILDMKNVEVFSNSNIENIVQKRVN
jgi:hypothetical protein